MKDKKFARSSCRGFVAQWLERPIGNRKTRVRSPAGLRCVFFRLIQLSVHICRIEKERSLIRWNGPNRNEFSIWTTKINRPYFSRPRKYRRLFSEPTYWPRRSQGQYGEGNNQAGIFEAEGNKNLIPGRLARSQLTCPSTREKCETKASCLCLASATMQTQVVRGRPVQNGLIDFFPPAIVNPSGKEKRRSTEMCMMRMRHDAMSGCAG